MKLSNTFRDRLVKPKDSVVYWTDYVIKHKGAYHLRPAAADLYWFQTLLIDIIVFLLVLSFILVYILRKTVTSIWGVIKSPPAKTKLFKPGAQMNGSVKNGLHLKQNWIHIRLKTGILYKIIPAGLWISFQPSVLFWSPGRSRMYFWECCGQTNIFMALSVIIFL